MILPGSLDDKWFLNILGLEFILKMSRNDFVPKYVTVSDYLSQSKDVFADLFLETFLERH